MTTDIRWTTFFPWADADPEGVQRGSVMDFASNSPGDPLTPGVGATADAKRLAVKKPRASQVFRYCRSPTVTRSLCWLLCKGHGAGGMARGRWPFLIALARVLRKCI